MQTMFGKFGYDIIWKIKQLLRNQKSPNKILLRFYERYFFKKGSWIGYRSDFKGLPCFPHGPMGVFISNDAKIGKNAVIFQQVTIGSNQLKDSAKKGSPIIGDNVYIGSGAKIIGAVIIGDNCRIGANTVVYKDLPPNSVAVQSPTRIIQKDNLVNRFYQIKNSKLLYFCDGKWVKSEKDVEE
jgi:serine O-acetyltransferase